MENEHEKNKSRVRCHIALSGALRHVEIHVLQMSKELGTVAIHLPIAMLFWASLRRLRRRQHLEITVVKCEMRSLARSTVCYTTPAALAPWESTGFLQIPSQGGGLCPNVVVPTWDEKRCHLPGASFPFTTCLSLLVYR